MTLACTIKKSHGKTIALVLLVRKEINNVSCQRAEAAAPSDRRRAVDAAPQPASAAAPPQRTPSPRHHS
jgi:hypothetical protein